MGLREDLPALVKEMNCARSMARMQHNMKLLDIHEGNLEYYVLEALKEQLTPVAFNSAKTRVASINILRKLIDKQSQVYEVAPVRKLLKADGQEGGESDKGILSFYEDKFEMDINGAHANIDFNLYKTFAYEPFIDGKTPKLRVIPSDRFFPFSNDRTNPLRMTHFVKIMGMHACEDKVERTLYYAYTDTEILPFYVKDDQPTIATDVMQINKMDGMNPYRKIPFVYVGRSRVDLVPQIDTDTLSMTILIPCLLTDLNYAVMYQSFSIMYTIDAVVTGTRAPNAWIEMKSDKASAHKPEIGTIKPQVDIPQVVDLIRTEMSMWMESRNIKPGAMGSASIASVSSGVAKMIDEMDTSADRKKQVPFMQSGESQLFDLVFGWMHPVWVQSVAQFEMKVMPSKGVKVHSQFAEQRPVIDPSQRITDQAAKLTAGLTSRKRAVSELNPDWDEKQVDELLAEIAEEKTAAVQDAQAGMDAQGVGAGAAAGPDGGGAKVPASKSTTSQESMVN